MPKPMKSNNEKAKNFTGSIKRLFHELKSYRILIFVALIFAVLGSILSILTPNKLSSLIDEISSGLVIKSDNMELLSTEISNNLSNIDINSIITSDYLSQEEKLSLYDQISKIDRNDKSSYLNILLNLPDTLLVNLIPSINIDNVLIDYNDQLEYLNIMSTLNDDASVNDIYSKIDELPTSIQTIVKPSMDLNQIKNIIIFLVILYVLSSLFTYLESIFMTTSANKFAKELRSSISNKINKLPLKYFDKNQTGDILSRVTNDVDTIAQSMNQSLSSFVSSITLFIGTVIMMFITNWIMAITAIVSSLIGFVFMAKVLSKSQKHFIERQKYLGEINSHIEESYSGINIIKAYNGQREVNEKFDELNEKVYDANRKSQFLSGLMMPMMSFIGNFGYVAVCIVGALLAMNGKISFGVIVAFITYVRLFTSPLTEIGQAMTSIQSTAAASERVFEFLDEIEMPNEQEISNYLDKSKAKGNIEFENVCFTYDGNKKPTIKNFSAKIKKGQKIAIVGPTGAGKTTIVNLLMKFYDINSGDIKIDSISIKNIKRENVHDLFTMVLQDTWLFDGTIKENILFNRQNISDEKVQEVCQIVGVDHFIKTLPNGYDSIISDNETVSSGQKQLLTIARGMLEDTPFLILDEATSNVDTRTEELVQKAMDKLCEGRTSFIIAHRLSTIKNADLILVMKNGNIIEQGNHNELIAKNGFYAELYNSQFEL